MVLFDEFHRRSKTLYTLFGTLLRALSQANVDLLLDAAKCTIAKELNNKDFDSYVLSESSLFVYPHKMILKTCGTMQLLKSIPILLDCAAGLAMKVQRSKYTRGMFMFPFAQPYPHGSIGEEVGYLDHYFGKLGSGGKAYVIRNAAQFPNWHIYMASDENNFHAARIYTLEMCMTKLDGKKVVQFFNVDDAKTGSDTMATSSIESLLPQAQTCDFAFDPCGYSMNPIKGEKHSTIHVTPEDEFSFVSFKTMGYGLKDVDVAELVCGVTAIFKPASFFMFLHVTSGAIEGADRSKAWGKLTCPHAY